MTHKILLTIFAMLTELGRDFVSERTKEGLRARREQGLLLGKPKGVVQPSMYDVDRERVLHLHALGVPLTTIVDVHLKASISR
ncbi:recombinase family protein [Hymenobacter montanus]|uniref:recombinase family protein n=1 Tax=Hymenobacter montanus TaxID=2771359 RepID=UPI001CC28605|nr:recombinase family protein [Hymenobacter montanus]